MNFNTWLCWVRSTDKWWRYHCTIIKFWTSHKTAEDCWWTAHPFSCCRAVRHEGDHPTVHCLRFSTSKYPLASCPLCLIKKKFSCVSHSPTSGLGISRMSTSTMRNFTTTLSRFSKMFKARKKGRKSVIFCCGGTGKQLAFHLPKLSLIHCFIVMFSDARTCQSTTHRQGKKCRLQQPWGSDVEFESW